MLKLLQRILAGISRRLRRTGRRESIERDRRESIERCRRDRRDSIGRRAPEATRP
jgi:hypothetical protein